MNIRNHAIVASVILAALGGCSSESKDASKKPDAAAAPLRVEESVEVLVSAKVKAIDYTTREVTLRDDAGNELSFIAGPRVQRLNEIHPGDVVDARYVVTLTGELRPPTAEEKANPIMVSSTGGRTSNSGNIGRGVTVVTTVTAVDVPKMLVTLKGPMGDQATVRARKEENIKKLKVGDTIVISYTEALGVSVERAK